MPKKCPVDQKHRLTVFQLLFAELGRLCYRELWSSLAPRRLRREQPKTFTQLKRSFLCIFWTKVLEASRLDLRIVRLYSLVPLFSGKLRQFGRRPYKLNLAFRHSCRYFKLRHVCGILGLELGCRRRIQNVLAIDRAELGL